jgi:hypothetical protein
LRLRVPTPKRPVNVGEPARTHSAGGRCARPRAAFMSAAWFGAHGVARLLLSARTNVAMAGDVTAPSRMEQRADVGGGRSELVQLISLDRSRRGARNAGNPAVTARTARGPLRLVQRMSRGGRSLAWLCRCGRTMCRTCRPQRAGRKLRLSA